MNKTIYLTKLNYIYHIFDINTITIWEKYCLYSFSFGVVGKCFPFVGRKGLNGDGGRVEEGRRDGGFVSCGQLLI
jgi:hypothetical protein